MNPSGGFWGGSPNVHHREAIKEKAVRERSEP